MGGRFRQGTVGVAGHGVQRRFGAGHIELAVLVQRGDHDDGAHALIVQANAQIVGVVVGHLLLIVQLLDLQLVLQHGRQGRNIRRQAAPQDIGLDARDLVVDHVLDLLGQAQEGVAGGGVLIALVLADTGREVAVQLVGPQRQALEAQIRLGVKVIRHGAGEHALVLAVVLHEIILVAAAEDPEQRGCGQVLAGFFQLQADAAAGGDVVFRAAHVGHIGGFHRNGLAQLFHRHLTFQSGVVQGALQHLVGGQVGSRKPGAVGVEPLRCLGVVQGHLGRGHPAAVLILCGAQQCREQDAHHDQRHPQAPEAQHSLFEDLLDLCHHVSGPPFKFVHLSTSSHPPEPAPADCIRGGSGWSRPGRSPR